MRRRFWPKVLVVLLAAACPSLAAVAAAAPSSDRVAAAALQRALADTVAGKAAGTVLVARDGKVLTQRSFAGTGQDFVARADTIYDIASIGKTFTAVLALRLADAGQFDLDRPLRDYLPELPAEMSDITARNALAHDAALPRYLEGDDLVPRTAAQALAEIAAMKRTRAAGTGYYYSNVGPQLVALALERAGGDTYQRLIRRWVFKPLGMKSSFFHGDPALRRKPVASAYADGKNGGSPATWPDTWSMLGAAGIASTAGDMWRFNRGVFAGRLLSPRSRQALMADGVSTKGSASYLTPDTLDIHYGAGLFHFRDRKGRRLHFHGGSSDFGSATAMLWRADDDVFVLALFNSTTTGYDRGKMLTAILDALDTAGM